MATSTPARGATTPLSATDLPPRAPELRAYEPSWRERLAWNLAELFGNSRYSKQDIARTVEEAADFVPLLGEALGADDTARALDAGDYSGAALAGAAVIAGTAPIVGDSVSKALKSITNRRKKEVASRSGFIYDAPSKPPRAFEADYPEGAPADDAGNLLADIDGRPLVAERVAGRRVVGGDDQPLRPQEMAEVAAAGTGRSPQAVAGGSKELGRDMGRYVVTRDRRSGSVVRDIFVDGSLAADKAGRVLSHEVGHMIDDLAGAIPVAGLNDELRVVYNDLNNPQRHGRRFGPEQSGYKGDGVHKELMAEALRAYAANPNYLKTVAPKTAARIRQYVNDNPNVNRVIQFNSLLATGGAAAGGLMLAQGQAEAAENKMARFEIETPDGRYEVEAPDMETALRALTQRPRQSDQRSRAPTTDRPVNDAAHVVTGGLIEGVPVVGPMIRGGLDRIGAGIRSLANDTSYEDELAFVQGRSAELKEDMPVTDTVSQIGGAVAGTIPLIMAAPAAFGAGGGGLLARSVASGATGAGIGAADSAVRSDGEARDTIRGAIIGGGTGIAGPAVGRVAGAGWQRLRDYRAARAAASETGVDASTATRVGRAARDDGLDPAAIRQRMEELGPDAMLMDLGPNLQRQAGALAATPGPGQEIVRTGIATRQAAAGERVSSALDKALGRPVDALARADEIVIQRANAAKPLYEKAYREGAEGVWTPELERMAGSPMFANAMRDAAARGQDRAVLDGFGSFNPRVTVTQDGRIGFNQTRQGGSPLYPDLQYWDYVKRELDDIAGAAKRAGRGEEAAIATNLASKLRTELDGAVPSYKAAREAYSGPSAILDAMEEGQRVFSNSVTPGQLRRQMKGMTDAEREAFAEGARAQIADMMGTARSDALAARTMFMRGYNREKLRILIGQDEAQRVIGAINSEAAFARTRDIVTGNSETAARSAAMREVTGEAGPQFGIREGYMSGGLMGSARSAGVKSFEWVRDAISAANRDAKNSGLARALASKDVDKIVEALSKAKGAPVDREALETVAKSLLIGAGVGASRP